MILGINFVPPHRSPDEWGCILHENGVHAASLPVDYTAKTGLVDRYVKAAQAYDIVIAEVGVWNSPNVPDKNQAQLALEKCEEQLRLADYVEARCCVNVSGAAGELWFGCYAENFTQDLYKRNVEIVQHLCDTVKPKHTYYTYENMQWMLPDSPKQYLQVIKDVDRDRFAVHMDAVNMIKCPETYLNHREVMDEAFELLGDKIKSCHLKDCLMENGVTVSIKEVMCGQGYVDIPYYLDKIQKLEDDVPVLIEHLSTWDEYLEALKAVRGLFDFSSGQ